MFTIYIMAWTAVDFDTITVIFDRQAVTEWISVGLFHVIFHI
jgi:hypothetical protein